MDVLRACVYVHHMHAWCLQRQKRVLQPLELQLQAVLSHCVGAEDGTLVPYKCSKCS